MSREKILKRIEIDPETGCWFWRGMNEVIESFPLARAQGAGDLR